MQWSHYSEALKDAYTDTANNLMVEACPGSGKTTNIARLWGLDDKPTCYLVFNKHNQLEAQAKLQPKPGSAVLTLNGLGHRAIMSTFDRPTLDDNKVYRLIDAHTNFPQRVRQEYKLRLAHSVRQAKTVALDSTMDRCTYVDMVSTFDLDEYPGMFEDTNTILSISDDQTHVIDYADQIRIPALYRCEFPHYATVLCDESQDISPIQGLLLERLGADRYVYVGDAHQSIYGFRGAMNGSMDYLAQEFNCTRLPLSITYRCARSIVREASQIFPGIEAWSESPEGTVLHRQTVYDCGSPMVQSVAQFKGSHDALVVCRYNRPLIQLAYALLAHDVPCHVRGRDIGQGLIKIVQSLPCNTVSQFITRLDEWFTEESEKTRGKQDERRLQSLEDKYASLQLFCGKCRPSDHPGNVVQAIDNIFSEGRGICLSTIHRAKGLEAQTTYILESQLYGYSVARASQPWQAEQEHNAQYVAVTRAKNQLVYM